MANKEEIIKAILDVAGNPEVGVVRDFAEAWADAIVAIDNPVVVEKKDVKEVRVVKAEETR